MSLLQNMSHGWKAYVLLALITFSAAIPGVFNVPVLDRDEARFAQASRQMLETGDFVRIRYQEEARNKKPSGIYWLQAASAAPFIGSEAGNSPQIWPYRLPALLGAVLAVLATFWCGLPLIGRRGAFLGAAMFGAGFLLTSEAHIAKTDAVLVGLTVLLMGVLARLYVRNLAQPLGRAHAGAPLKWMLLFWGFAGVSFLIKGPVALWVAGLAVLAVSLASRNFRWVRPLADWRGGLLFGALVLPWLVAIQWATNGAFVGEALGQDLGNKLLSSAEGHDGWPGYHALFSILLFFPATLFLVPSIVLAGRVLRHRALETLPADQTGLVFLVSWIVPAWLFFEFLPTKLAHYVLPLYPALALVCGWGAVQLMGEARAELSRWVSIGVFLAGGLLACLIISPIGATMLQTAALEAFTSDTVRAAAKLQWDEANPVPVHFLIPGILLVVIAAAAMALRRFGLAAFLAIAASLFICWHTRLVFLPGQSWMQASQVGSVALDEVCGLPDQDTPTCNDNLPDYVHVVGYAEPSLVFRLGTKTRLSDMLEVTLPEADDAFPMVYLLNLENRSAEMARAALLEQAKRSGRNVQQSEIRYAQNYSNGKAVAFVAIRIG